MKKIARKTEAGEQYATAHEAHYGAKDLAEALGQYRAVMGAHPETKEAEYSQSQIQNIVKAVVPKQRLHDAQVELALAHVAHSSSPSIVPNPGNPTAAGSPGGTA